MLQPQGLRTAAALSLLSYAHPRVQREKLEKIEGYQDFAFLDSRLNAAQGHQAPDTGTQVSLLATRDALWVAARGTPLQPTDDPETDLQWQDLRNDLAAWPTSNYAGTALVASGFKRAADGIWEQLLPHLARAMAENKEIHLTGHSLGAAVATHLGERMHHELGSLPDSLTTFGSPDVGWRAHQQHLRQLGLEERTLRFVNHLDPVPGALPLGKPLGKTLYINSQGLLEEGACHFGDRLKGLGRALLQLQLNPLQDHYPLGYYEALKDPRNSEALAQLGRP